MPEYTASMRYNYRLPTSVAGKNWYTSCQLVTTDVGILRLCSKLGVVRSAVTLQSIVSHSQCLIKALVQVFGQPEPQRIARFDCNYLFQAFFLIPNFILTKLSQLYFLTKFCV